MPGDAGTLGGLVHSLPDNLLRDGYIGPPALHGSREQVGPGLHPTPVLTQSLQQLRRQQHVAVTSALALAHMNDHPLAVDIGDLEMAHLGPAQTRCIQHHQHGAMHQVPGAVDKPGHLLLIQDGRQSPRTLGERNVIGKIGPAQRLDKEKRSAAVRPSMVPGESLRSRNRYAWYWRICSGPRRSGERWKYFAKSSTA